MGDITPPASQWLGPTPPISRYYPQAPPPSPPPGQFAKMGGGGWWVWKYVIFFKRNPRVRTAARVSRADAGRSGRGQRGHKGADDGPSPGEDARPQGRREWVPLLALLVPGGSRPAPARDRSAPLPGGRWRFDTARRRARGLILWSPFSPFLEPGGRALPSPRNPHAPAGFCPVPPPPVFPPRSRTAPDSAGVTVCGDHPARRLRSRFRKESWVSGGTGPWGGPGTQHRSAPPLPHLLLHRPPPPPASRLLLPSPTPSSPAARS